MNIDEKQENLTSLQEAKNKLLDVYQLKLEKGWYWQKKENMSPWKVFSVHQFKHKSLICLLFRVHKLCFAKLNYFTKTLNDWQPVIFEPDRMLWSDFILEKDWITAEAFRHKKTGRIITLTKLQQIKVKSDFINWIEVITNEKFPNL